MKISNLTLSLLAAAAIAASGGASAQPMSREAHDQAYKAAGETYRIDKAACASLAGNARDICIEEAKGREKVAKADADAAYKNTPKAREEARVARADAAYEVAKEKCDDLSGNAKDVCVKEAKAAHVKAKADARVDRVAADARNDGAQRTAEARQSATEDKREADYKVAIEKCDALAGSAKDACVRDAKARHGRT